MKYVVIDRDGTLIKHVPYLHDPGQVELLPTVADGLAALQRAGCSLFLHTNQSGIGRGWFTMDQAQACNREMLRLIGLGDAVFVDICVSPERPDEPAVFRKPSPGYGLSLMRRFGAGKDEMCYLGDNLTDLQTAENLGCAGIGVDTGGHDLARVLREKGMDARFPVVASFADAAALVIAGGGRR